MVLRSCVAGKTVHATTRALSFNFLVVARDFLLPIHKTSDALASTSLAFLYPSLCPAFSKQSLRRKQSIRQSVSGIHRRYIHDRRTGTGSDKAQSRTKFKNSATLKRHATDDKSSQGIEASHTREEVVSHALSSKSIHDTVLASGTHSDTSFEHVTPAEPVNLESLLSFGREKTPAEKQLIWRAWSGMSDDMQATRLQLLESLLEMLQTDDLQDAYKLRALLDAKYSLIDEQQRNFYTFWAHMTQREPELALKYFTKLAVGVQEKHWEHFMLKIIDTGNFNVAVLLWNHLIFNYIEWRGTQCIRELLYLVPNLHTWQFLNVLAPSPALRMKRIIRNAVIIHLSETDQIKESSLVVADALETSNSLSDVSLSLHMRALTRSGAHAAALELYYQVLEKPTRPQRHYRMSCAAVDAAAITDDIKSLRLLLDTGVLDLLARPDSRIRIIEPYTTVMAAFARHGLVLEVENLFRSFQALNHGNRPDVIMYSTLVHARVQTLEVSKALELFLACRRDFGFKPDQILHNVLLHAFADALDSQAASYIVLAMLEAGFRPDVYTASTLIDLFAHTMDAEGAELALKKMLQLGVKPNIEVYGSLLHAYVKADDLDRARNAFREFQSTGLRPNTRIMNVLLKQFRAEGRPAADMQRFVKEMQAFGIQPNDTTQTQIMRALLAEGNLKDCVELFQSLEHPNEYHYTVLMVGFIREDTSESHDALLYYYNELLDRDLKPSFVTLAVLMNAFVLRGNQEFATRASNLLDSLASWYEVDLSSSFVPRVTPSPDVYAPLLKRNKAGNVNFVDPIQVFRTFLENIAGTDGRPDVRTMTSILSIYAEAGATARVRELFVAIKKEADRLYRYNLGPPLGSGRVSRRESPAAVAIAATLKNKPEPEESDLSKVTRGARYVLSAPLTVFMKHMATMKRYAEIERVWMELSEQGYDYDISNWNTYVQVQIQQGQIKRACELFKSHLQDEGSRVFRRTKFALLEAMQNLKNDRAAALQSEMKESLGRGERENEGDEAIEAEDRRLDGPFTEWMEIVRDHGDLVRDLGI